MSDDRPDGSPARGDEVPLLGQGQDKPEQRPGLAELGPLSEEALQKHVASGKTVRQIIADLREGGTGDETLKQLADKLREKGVPEGDALEASGARASGSSAAAGASAAAPAAGAPAPGGLNTEAMLLNMLKTKSPEEIAQMMRANGAPAERVEAMLAKAKEIQKAGPLTGAGKAPPKLGPKEQIAMLQKAAAAMTVERAKQGLASGMLIEQQISSFINTGKLKPEVCEFFVQHATEEAQKAEDQYREVKAKLDADPKNKALKLRVREARDFMYRKSAFQSRLTFNVELGKVPKLKPWKLILLIGWSLMMASLDASIINICNPLIQHEKHFVGDQGEIPMSTLQWVNDIYSIAFSAFAIPASKIGDRFGVTVVHRIGVFGFVIFSALCGLSRYIDASTTPWEYGGFYVLIVARFFQGIFAAFNLANTMSLCGTLVVQEDVTSAMSMNSMAFAAATALGPPLGGFLGEYAGWEYCFFINIVIGGISIVFCWIFLPKTPKFKEAKLDLWGGLLILLGLVLLILGFTYLPPDRENLTLGVVAALAGIACLVWFVFWELRHPFAILPRGILTNQKIMYSLLAGLFNFALITTVGFQMPFALQNIHKLSPSTVGLMSLVNPIAQTLASFACNFLAKHMASYIIKVVSSVVVAVLIVILGYVVPYDIVWIILNNACFSFMLGIFFTTNNQFMMAVATPDIRGMMGGCIQAFREAGYAIGIATVNVVHDIYMSINWTNAGHEGVPYPQIMKNPEWREYVDVYYDAFAVTDIAMAFVSIFSMIFGLMSGVSPHEADLLFFPKKDSFMDKLEKWLQTGKENRQQKAAQKKAERAAAKHAAVGE